MQFDCSLCIKFVQNKYSFRNKCVTYFQNCCYQTMGFNSELIVVLFIYSFHVLKNYNLIMVHIKEKILHLDEQAKQAKYLQ
jgi:hypothetical protein